VAEPSGRSDLLGLWRGGEGAITGTVVCAAAIAYSAGQVETVGRLCVTILGTVAVYWIAHLHAVTIGSALTHRHHPVAAIRHALAETWPIAAAAVVPLGVLLLTTLLGVDLAASRGRP
jgi:ABC-type multidrug transport system permease subunit